MIQKLLNYSSVLRVKNEEGYILKFFKFLFTSRYVFIFIWKQWNPYKTFESFILIRSFGVVFVLIKTAIIFIV